MGPAARFSREAATTGEPSFFPRRRKTARKGGLSIVDRGSAEPRASHYAARTSRGVRIQVASADDRGERQ